MTGDSQEPEIVTFGCRLNTYESEVMRQHARDAGLDNAIIFNTCAVTNEATRQARQAIRRARKTNPGAKIIVTGCAAQVDPEMFAEMDEVSHVLGNQEKMEAAHFHAIAQPSLDFGISASEKAQVNDIMSVTETAGHLVEGLEGRARAFIQIQNGCDHRCTFCIIPFGRGNSRSVPAGEVITQVRKLVENGYREVVLTGVDVTSYGADLPGTPTLGRLCQQILKHVPELPRLRLSSIDSIEMDEALFDLVANDCRLMPHLHLSLQAGDNMILKRMKRRHSREDSIRLCADLRRVRPDIVFGADLIAGFPTETDAMFENSLRLVEECGLTYLHVFPYSARPGTPAAKMPQVHGTTIRERADRLRSKGDVSLATYLAKQNGRIDNILIEKIRTDGTVMGRTEGFAPTIFNESSDKLTEGELVRARIVDAFPDCLTGQLIAA